MRRIRSRKGGDYAYDLCIIDWNMPKMNGCEVTRKIRQDLGEDMTVIIAIVYDIGEFEEEAKEARANKIVSKPLFQSTLFDILVSSFGSYHPEKNRKDITQLDLTGMHVLLAIVAMTANAFAEDVAEALSKGMNAHIAKPINYDKLFAVLQQFSDN